MKKRTWGGGIVFLFLVVLICMCISKPVNGTVNIHYMPERNTKFMTSAFPSLDMRNAQITVNQPGITYSFEDYAGSPIPGTDGKVIVINLEGNHGKDGDRWCSPDYPMTIRFNNCYKIGNSYVDIVYDIKKIYSHYKFLSSWDLPFLCIPNNADACPKADMFPWVYGYTTDIELVLDIGVCYHGSDKYIYSTDFYLACGDLDIKYEDQVYPESCWLNEGFTGDFYLWEGHYMDIVTNPRWEYPWFCATGKQSDTGIKIEGDNSWFYGGFIAPLSSGVCTATYYTEGCGTYIIFGCNFSSLDPPKKTAEQKDYYEGDTLKWNIVADMYKLYDEGFNKLDTFRIEDTLQPGQVYKSAKVTRDGSDVTNQFNITYNETTREFVADCKSSYLQLESFYNGKPFTLELTCEVDSANVPVGGFLPNEGVVIYNGTPDTVTTKVPVKYKLTTSYEGQGTISEDIDNIPDGGSCSASYAPAENWCLQKLVIDGEIEITGEDLIDYISTYSFTNVHKDHHVHAVFVPNYRITIQKKIDKNLEVFGKPYFGFKIEGTDVYGDNHVWYRQLEGNSQTTWIVPQGIYTVTELPVERYALSKITGISNADSTGICTVLDGNAHVLFENTFDDYKDYGHNDSKINKLK